MREPIKAGDLCIVVNGLMGLDSPNIGLIVMVKQYVGDEQTLGRIWRCEAEYGERIQPRPNIPMGLLDFAQDWLRKIDPAPVDNRTEVVEEDHII
jgi:hypothetical protein